MSYKAERGEIKDARMLTLTQACDYTGLGTTYFQTWAKEIGCFRKFGRATRYDKKIIDAALDQLQQPEF